jgi:hypothetical protein
MSNLPARDPAPPSLSPLDEGVIDALFAAALDPDRIGSPGSPDRARAGRAVRLLSLLDSDVRPHSALADATFARVIQMRRAGDGGLREAPLSIQDQAALDAWVMSGFSASAVSASLRDRARRLDALAGLVTAPAAAQAGIDAPALVEKTLARVQLEIEAQAGRLQLDVRPGRRGVRLADLVSVAAVLLIGSGILMPILNSVRDQSQRQHCLANLGATAMAFGAYASANRDELPLASASLGTGKWWEVGQPQHSNSANLFTLVRTGYTPLQNLACPGNPGAATSLPTPDARDWRRLDEVSYSYQIMFGRSRPRWNDGRLTVILADRSPVVPRSIRGEMFNPLANAPNHHGRGQHLLWNDGSSTWAKTPVLATGDNIWLNRAAERVVDVMTGKRLQPLTGTEMPDPGDVCLGP